MKKTGFFNQDRYSSEDLSYVCESILHIWSIGIKDVAANVVFEDVWKAGDAELFEEQLCQLADVTIERDLWKICNTTLFWRSDGITEETYNDDKNWCGTGSMVSIDDKGDLYPCVRFQDYSISNPNRKGRSIGNIYEGFDQDKLRAFHCLRKSLQSSKECLECKMQHLCAWCTGFNYDVADSDTIFQRMTFICEMHKAQWRANEYYWKQLEKKRGIKIEGGILTGFRPTCLL